MEAAGGKANGRNASRSAQAGMLVGAAAAAKSFERTLMVRTTTDQGAVTGLSVAMAYSTTAIFQDLIENAAALVMKHEGGRLAEDELRRVTMLADALAVGAGMFVQHSLVQVEGESLGRAGTRTAGYFATMAGLAGFTAGFIQDLLDVVDPNEVRVGRDRNLAVGVLGGGLMVLAAEYRRRKAERQVSEEDRQAFLSQEWNIQAGKSILTGLGITAGLGVIAAGERVLGSVVGRALAQGMAGSPRFWRMAGHAGALGLIGAAGYVGLDSVYQRIEAGTGKIEPAFTRLPESPLVSGSAESAVHWRRMGREGRRHVLTALPASVIAEVMEEAARADPIRVYVGLESAKTELERVSLAIRELERTGAFDRALLIAVSPTGTGYVNYAAIECCEYFTLGNCATVTLQYSKRPSPMSLDRVWEGRKQFRMLLAAMRRELYKRDPEHRPRLVVFGESLGAHTSQDAFLHEGTQGLEDAGIDRALWIGSPHLSKWKAQVLGEPRADVDRSLLMDVNDFGEIEALSETERRKLRYIMITHHNDGVGLFGADLAIQKPPWLGDPELRPPTVPKWMRWAPIVTSIQTVIDMKNAMNVVPGVFVANGHDYRADLARFVREVYDLPATDLQLARVEAALREYELLRQKLIEGTEAPAKTSAGDDFRDEIAA